MKSFAVAAIAGGTITSFAEVYFGALSDNECLFVD